MIDHSENAKRMQEIAMKASTAAFERIVEVIEASDLDDRRKTGAGIVAVSSMYGSVLANLMEQPDDHPGAEPTRSLAMGMFGTLISDPLDKMMQSLGQGAVIVTAHPDSD